MPTDCVLVVEDDHDLRVVLVELIQDTGYTVVAVDSIAAAHAQLAHADFDALLIDIMLPDGGNGIDILREAKRQDPDAQVIMMSAHATRSLAIDCIHQGAFDFLQKPFDGTKVIATLFRAIEHRRLRTSHRIRKACDAIAATSDAEALPDVIVQTAASALRADDATLLLSADADHLYVVHTSACGGVPVGALVPADHVAGQVLASRQPALITGDASGLFHGAPRVSSARSSIVYPLVAGERAVGVLTVNRRHAGRPFRPADLEDSALVASHALLALENSRLVRQLAMTSRLAAIGQFSNAIVHEINNPLGCVVSGVGAIKALVAAHRHDLPASAQVQLEEIAVDLDEACGLLATLALDVRALAIDDARLGPIDLAIAASTAARIARVEVQQHKATLVMQLDAPAHTHGDVGRVAQALINLIRNAAHAGPRTIHVRTSTTEDCAVIEVIDDGRGIASVDLARIFDPYFTRGAGTGLGLWVTREIVTRLGGKVVVRSELGAGSTFRLEFPRRN